MGQPETGDGWYFNIEGRYEEHLADKALNPDPLVQPYVGLKAAATLDVSNTSVSLHQSIISFLSMS